MSKRLFWLGHQSIPRQGSRLGFSEYGFFAFSTPLFDTELALEEIAYAFEGLAVEGISLFTNYTSGHAYLGHKAPKPI